MDALASQLQGLTKTESVANPDSPAILGRPQVVMYQSGISFDFEIVNIPETAKRLGATLSHKVRSIDVTSTVDLGEVSSDKLGMRGRLNIPRELNRAKISFFYTDAEGKVSELSSAMVIRTNVKAVRGSSSRRRGNVVTSVQRQLDAVGKVIQSRFRSFEPSVGLNAPQVNFKASRGAEALVITGIPRTAQNLGVEVTHEVNGVVTTHRGIVTRVRAGLAKLALRSRIGLVGRTSGVTTLKFYYVNSAGIESEAGEAITFSGTSRGKRTLNAEQIHRTLRGLTANQLRR